MPRLVLKNVGSRPLCWETRFECYAKVPIRLKTCRPIREPGDVTLETAEQRLLLIVMAYVPSAEGVWVGWLDASENKVYNIDMDMFTVYDAHTKQRVEPLSTGLPEVI